MTQIQVLLQYVFSLVLTDLIVVEDLLENQSHYIQCFDIDWGERNKVLHAKGNALLGGSPCSSFNLIITTQFHLSSYVVFRTNHGVDGVLAL